ncbi:hypothetical protein [Xenorhabdus innexi]|uniref:Uncharacterized protein n=1 Tax=Xenorhabdus innexi TaxID=290109 RepID=A0A1N6MY34_9GAMM|nr:hypothetical protein [Xenorhabdus innexi]PHM38777.1 hypothetical protein Xinn_00062 [Xenorhabdus innexi]SIP73785.1 conserved exported hypothetical protein [Xenorhabdus innexi]
MKKINLYSILFFIVSIIFHNANAAESDRMVIIPYIKNSQEKKPGIWPVPPFYYYNLTIKNESKHDTLNIDRIDDRCMYNSGEKSFSVSAGGSFGQEIEIKNTFGIPLCTGIAKTIDWTTETIFNNKKYKGCDITLDFSYNPTWLGPGMGWFYHVDTARGCDLTVTVDCGGGDCLNNDGYPINDNNNITITIKDDNDWEPPRITSPAPNTVLDNNWVLVSGEGLNEDGTLPELSINSSITSSPYFVSVTATSNNHWESNLWLPCGLGTSVSIKDVDNSGLIIDGSLCEATITSMQDGETIPAGEYSLSGLANIDSRAGNVQVQITGYNNDGTVYSSEKSYASNIDTDAGKWTLKDLEAVCSIQYKASASPYLYFSIAKASAEVSYSAQNCPASITSPKPNSTADNNYITVSGKGRTEDGEWPELVTSFDKKSYSTQPTGDGDNWVGHIWMPCGITGTVSITGMGNSGVTFNGPPCGETITSIQDGQTIPAGKYSLSGQVNSDTVDDEKHIQVQITGYNNDGTVYSPEKSYTPSVDTDTGKWTLEGLEAICSIHYKASVSKSSSELQSVHQSLLPGMPGKSEVSYSAQNCSASITSPEPNSTIGNNYISVSGKGRAEDGNWPVLVTSFDNNSYSTQHIGDGDDWEVYMWVPCGITGTVSITGMGNSGVTFNGPPCGETITSIQDGQTIPAGKYDLSGLVNSDTAGDARDIQVQITGYNNDGTIYSPTKSYTPSVETDTGKWTLEYLTAVCSINYKASVSESSSELQSVHQSLLPGMPGKSEVSYSVQACSVKITKPEDKELISSNTQDTQNVSIEGKADTGITVEVSYKSGNSESSPSPASSDNDTWHYEAQEVPVGFITITAVGKDSSGGLMPDEKDEVTILSSKLFSVATKNDGVFTEFYGTSMPTIEDEGEDEYLDPDILISLDGVGSIKIAVPDENGNWKYEDKNYARRGKYTFTFEEESNNESYDGRGKKNIECTGGDDGMNCTVKN